MRIPFFISVFILSCVFQQSLQAQCGNPFLIGHVHTEEDFRSKAKNFIQEHNNNPILRTANQLDTIVIPIVFNILFEDSVADNYLFQQYRFRQAIDSANKYMNTNLETIIGMNIPDFHDILAMPYIRMEIARLDPQGNPTDGFRYRKWNAINSNQICGFPFLTGQEAIKLQSKGGITAWNQRFFLNFWVGNFRKTSGSCFGGQSSYPTFPFLQGDPLSFMDGILMQSYYFENNNFSNMNYFSTLIHEVGHYLGLLHIWGGIVDDSQVGCNIDDLIDDTPNQEDATYVCRFDRNTCIGGQNDKIDMCSNIMDYADGISFTQGQVDVMRSVLSNNGTRKQLPIPKMSAQLNVSNQTPCVGELVTLEWVPNANYRFLFPSWDLTNKNLKHEFIINKDTIVEAFITQGYDTLRRSVSISLQQPTTIQVSIPDSVDIGDTLTANLSNMQIYSTDIIHTFQDSTISWVVSEEVDSFWIYVENNCFSDSFLIEYIVRDINITSIFNNKAIHSLIVYPNPGNDVVFIDYPNKSDRDVIQVYNSESKLVRNVRGNAIKVSQLPVGNYYFVLEKEDKIYSGKFMKQ
jgi:hypothetical protein